LLGLIVLSSRVGKNHPSTLKLKDASEHGQLQTSFLPDWLQQLADDCPEAEIKFLDDALEQGKSDDENNQNKDDIPLAHSPTI